jgi:hypothetical protein
MSSLFGVGPCVLLALERGLAGEAAKLKALHVRELAGVAGHGHNGFRLVQGLVVEDVKQGLLIRCGLFSEINLKLLGHKFTPATFDGT